jgi:hypothetical protein
MKTCSNKHCLSHGVPQPKENFGKNSCRKDGLGSHCKACRHAKHLENYKDPAKREHERTRPHGRYFTQHKKDHCEACDFIPEHSCQLDVDHIDGNRHNNDVSNLKTLCANCHRLKTFLNKENRWTKTSRHKIEP